MLPFFLSDRKFCSKEGNWEVFLRYGKIHRVRSKIPKSSGSRVNPGDRGQKYPNRIISGIPGNITCFPGDRTIIDNAMRREDKSNFVLRTANQSDIYQSDSNDND